VSIIQEIYSWSQNLPAWQQDAIARLYLNRTLATTDIDDLFALAKAEYGIEDSAGRQPIKLVAAQFAAPAVSNRLVQITALKQLSNVNALAEGQRLPIAPTGLTIIYGENGAGKSGYSRVLKRACRARDQREPIFPNAMKEPDKNSTPRAVFETQIDGQPLDLTWTQGQPAPEQLSELSIFDTHCARAYIDNQGDFAYAPYGLDILGNLVTICNEIKSRLSQEKTANNPDTSMFAALAQTNTEAGKIVADLRGKTSVEAIKAQATMTAANLERLTTLNKTLAETDPKQKAQVLRLRGARFTALASRIDTAQAPLSVAKLKELRQLVDISNTAKKAAAIAAKGFQQTPGLLPGTGGEEWKALLDAARTYASISHAGHIFPQLPADSACPLCMNPLGIEGTARLASFDAFVKQAAEKHAKEARAAAAVAYRAIESAKLDLGIDEALAKELSDSDPVLATACARLQANLLERQACALKASAGEFNWDLIAALAEEPSGKVTLHTTKLAADAKILDESMDEKAKAALITEQSELEARRRLGELQAAALGAITKRELCAKLQTCIDSIVTTSISRKSTELSKTMATQEVANALNSELKALNVHELQVVMKPGSPGGKTQFKLALQLPSGNTPSAILSEGEQRAIAIASFLAEVKLGKGLGGIVFDDPVSSLDHRRRWHVASRLVAEAKHRQVIVFTHDIYFLCIIQQEAELAGLPATTQCISKGPAGFGVQADRLPFDTLSTTKRVEALRVLHENIARTHKAGDDAETTRLTREAYSHLRMAWERGVEEVLFQGVVTRFAEGVSTQKLKYVIVEDHDYEAINAGMTRSSKFSGHDPAAAAHLPTLHPDELKVDIEALETWRARVETRKAAVEANRK
jgi:hypothetical protein